MKYEKTEKLLGKGGYSSVYLCKKIDSNKKYAMKLSEENKNMTKNHLLIEYKILKHLSGGIGIPKVYAFGKEITESNTNYYLVQQLLGNNLSQEFKKYKNKLPKDTYISQDKTGTVNKGTTVNITLSNGPATTYNIIIDANQLSSGNPEATKNTLEAKLKNACPGVNFIFKFEKANSGIGYLAPNSDIKVGSNTLTQGHTYNVIINSN